MLLDVKLDVKLRWRNKNPLYHKKVHVEANGS